MIEISKQDQALVVGVLEEAIAHFERKIHRLEFKEEGCSNHSRRVRIAELYRHLDQLNDCLDRLESPAPTPAFTTRTVEGGNR